MPDADSHGGHRHDGQMVPAHQALDRAFWENQYRGSSHHAPSAPAPNSQLVAEASGLSPGKALDAGCGQGRDALWLASRGWQVTAVDFSKTALDAARRRADATGADIATLIEWVPADLTAWVPQPRAFDLVTAQYVHLPAGSYKPLLRRLADAVAPGGTLIIVGHHPSDLQTTMERGHAPELYLTAEEAAAALEPGDWNIQVAEARPHRAMDRRGRDVEILEAVLRAQRRH